MSKYNVGLKSLLQEGLSESEFYSDLVYTELSVQYKLIVAC